MKFHKRDIEEYAIKTDTFRILKNFKPFDSEELFIDNTEAKILQSGRIELLKVRNPYHKDYAYPGGPGLTIIISVRLFKEPIENVPTILILRTPRNNFMRGVPESKQEFSEVIHDFFSDLAIQSFEKENGPLTFMKLEKMVAFYNLKTSVKKIN